MLNKMEIIKTHIITAKDKSILGYRLLKVYELKNDVYVMEYENILTEISKDNFDKFINDEKLIFNNKGLKLTDDEIHDYALKFVSNKLNNVNSLLSNEYKIGFLEGVEKYMECINNNCI
jgi:hypothetical protein